MKSIHWYVTVHEDRFVGSGCVRHLALIHRWTAVMWGGLIVILISAGEQRVSAGLRSFSCRFVFGPLGRWSGGGGLGRWSLAADGVAPQGSPLLHPGPVRR